MAKAVSPLTGCVSRIILCGCPENPRFSKLSVTFANTQHADVSAFLSLERGREDRVVWHLIMTFQGWRIDDVVTPDSPSLKADMIGHRLNQ
jgi:hypothetical protein